MKEKNDHEQKEYQYEYDHFDLGFGMHYGVHSYFGEHLAFGRGANMIHIYPYKIYIGDEHDDAIDLSPKQTRVLRNIFGMVKRAIEAHKIKSEKYTGSMGPRTGNTKDGKLGR